MGRAIAGAVQGDAHDAQSEAAQEEAVPHQKRARNEDGVATHGAGTAQHGQVVKPSGMRRKSEKSATGRGPAPGDDELQPLFSGNLGL